MPIRQGLFSIKKTDLKDVALNSPHQNVEKEPVSQLNHKGHTALLLYKQNKGSKRIYLVHTEVPEAIQNEGVGQQLVERGTGFL